MGQILIGESQPLECPLWVKSRHQRVSASCPLYPQKRTLMSVSGCPLCAKSRHSHRQYAPRGELFANSDSRVRPNAPVPIPHRLSARPIAVRRRCHVYRRRSIVTRRSDRSPDDGSRGKTADEPSRNIAAACADWRGCGTGECQHH